MKKQLKEIFTNYFEHFALTACGCAFIYIFVSIAITGGYKAIEPNKVILGIEICMGVFLFLFGLSKVIRKTKEELRESKHE